jgi:hypothetical protein
MWIQRKNTQEVCIRNKKRKKKKGSRKTQSIQKIQNTESRCTPTLYAVKKKTVCDNIEDGNHEYERVGEYRITKITNLEKNDPQETPCTLPQNKQEDPV